jgi:catechol 2,3-dioxygenase-like lactoylglutathione lyase family enzyme
MTHSILPRPSLFSVELRTARWPTLVDWYRDALGLKVLVRVLDDEYALLEAGDTRLAILGRASAGEVPDVVVARERLLGMAMTVGEPTIHPEGFHELRVVDPDGNRLRLFAWALGHHA